MPRFWRYVTKTDECWLWEGELSHNGYGRFRTPTGRVPAHHYSLGLIGVVAPPNYQVDHLCRNRRCVNPLHLEVVTARENILRSESIAGRNSRKTHCLRGHPFSAENTYIATNQIYPRRQCKTCRELRRDKNASRR